MSKLKVDVEVDSTKVAGGLNASTQAVKKWASDLKGTITGAFGGAAVGMAIQKTLDSIQGMGDSADRMGRTIQEVQLLAQMAQLAGRELSNVELMLNNIAEAQVDALGGNEAKMATFRAAGFDEKSLSQTNELGVLQQMAKAFQGKSISELRGLGLSDIVGKKNVGMFSTMQEDLAGFFDTLKKRSPELLDPVAVQEFKTNTDLLNVSFASLWNQIGNALLPALTWLVDKINNITLAFEALGKGIGYFFGFMKHENNPNASILQRLEDLFINGPKGFAQAWDEAIEKYNEKERIKASAPARIAAAAEMAKMGPGDVPKKDQKEEVWKKLEVPDKLNFKTPGLENVGRGGFTGINLGLLGTISRETTNLLKAIEKNTRQRDFATGYNAMLEIMGKIFGVTVR